MSDNIAVLVLDSVSPDGGLNFISTRFSYINDQTKILDSLEKYEAYQDKKIIYITRNVLLNDLRQVTLPKFWQSEPTEFIFNCTDGYNSKETEIIAEIVNRCNLDITKVTLEANVVTDFAHYERHLTELGFTQMPVMFDSEYPMVGITLSNMVSQSNFLKKSKWFVTCSRNHNSFRFFKFMDLMRRDMLRWCHFSFSNMQNLYINRDNKDLIPIKRFDVWCKHMPDNDICLPAKKHWEKHRKEIYSEMPYTLPGEPEELGAHLGGMQMSESFINAHNDSYFCCLIETNQHNSIPGAFLPTEKVGKTMLLRKPFLVYATQDYLKNLRSLGFKTFSDFWDESYDSEPDPWKRAWMINNIMHDIRHSYAQSQLELMLLQMAEITDHNHNLMMKKLMIPHYGRTLTGDSHIKDIIISHDLTTHYHDRIEHELRFRDPSKWRKPHPKL